MTTPSTTTDDDAIARARRRHLRWGFWLLAVSSACGLALEALHAWKSPLYLDVGDEGRRLQWTLAHAHGTGLALVHLAFAWALGQLAWRGRRLALASACLVAASVLMPLGFLLGGAFAHGADPGLGALLVPPGGLLLVVALVLAALAVPRR